MERRINWPKNLHKFPAHFLAATKAAFEVKEFACRSGSDSAPQKRAANALLSEQLSNYDILRHGEHAAWAVAKNVVRIQ